MAGMAGPEYGAKSQSFKKSSPKKWASLLEFTAVEIQGILANSP